MRNFNFNPIQAGLFWNHIGWGGGTLCPLCFSSICCPITTKLGMIVLWHKIPSDVTMTSMTSYLLCRVSKTAENSLFLNRRYFFVFYSILFKLSRNIKQSNRFQKIKLDSKNRRFPCYDDVINLLLVSLGNMISFLSYFSNILLFQHSS